MDKKPFIKLIWHGHKTVMDIPRLLEETDRIEITLSPDYNHTLFRILNPGAQAADLEKIDSHGGPELLDLIATIRGLEEFEELTDVLRSSQATVQLVSPSIVIINIPSANRSILN